VVGTKHIRKLTIAYTLLAFVLFSVFQLESVRQRVLNESTVISTLIQGDLDNIPMTSVGIRVNSWLEASKWIAERPILGSDFNAISYVTRTAEKFQTEKLQGFGHLHNYYLEVWVAFGIVGLIFLAVFYREITVNVVNHHGKEERYLLYSFLIFWFIISMFESYNHKFLGLYVHTIILAGLYSLKVRKSNYN
jgi:O-antigen ligase